MVENRNIQSMVPVSELHGEKERCASQGQSMVQVPEFGYVARVRARPERLGGVVKEIEEIKKRWETPDSPRLTWINATDDIKSLLSFITTLEAKVKELECKRNVKFIQGRADQMVYDAELVNEYRQKKEQAESRIKEVEAGIKTILSDLKNRREFTYISRWDMEVALGELLRQNYWKVG